MGDYIVSVDAGNGSTNAIMKRKTRMYADFFPSVRAAVTGDSLGLGEQFEMDFEFIDWRDSRYVVGDDVIKSRRAIERHLGAFRYGDEFHQFLVAVSLARLGVKKGDVDLTLFAPPGLYSKAASTIKQRFCERNGQVAIQLKGDKKPRKWHYSNVTVWPEGVGAAACFMLDKSGNLVESDTLAGDVLLLDSGVHTLDAILLSDGNINPEALQHATWEAGGIKTHMLDPILRMVKQADDDFSLLSLDDIDYAIRHGIETGDYTMSAGRAEIDLAQVIEKHALRYSEWIANNIIDGVFGGLRGIKTMILVGGGATHIEQYLRKWYDAKILNTDEHSTAGKIHPGNMNAVGGLRLALMQANQAG